MPDLSPSVQLHDVAVLLHPQDDVAIAKVDLPSGLALVLSLPDGSRQHIQVRQFVPSGHKVALHQIACGERVHRYGHVIGFASQPILPGDYVHTHNLGLEGPARAHPPGADVKAVSLVPEAQRRTFLGYRRTDGRTGTRNYIAVISSVNCSAHVARQIAAHFSPGRLAAFPNVDGVIAFTHHSGCTFRVGSLDFAILQRTLAGIARHPNVGAYLFVGLGCETNQIHDLAARHGLHIDEDTGLVIQEIGGIHKTVEAGIASIERLLPKVNAVRRTSRPISELVLALQCGGSDSWSGVTANPVVGLVADQVVKQAGTVVLAETPEIYGAEHLLIRRAANPHIADKLAAQVRWWEQHTLQMDAEIDDNRSVGNEAGGLTTIYEKSLGGIAKAGSTPLIDVYDYAETVTSRGFVFMNSPGYDPVSVTGQVAGGCNLVLFTTGRGSVFGFKPAPSIKISTNSTTYGRMIDDMDLNAGQILEGVAMEEVASQLLELVIAVASGQPSRSEALGVGEAEFCPWHLGGMI